MVSADEGHVFHNRLTHTLEVAQIARRLAEKVLQEKEQAAIAESLGGVDPDVVEAAALAHDLGHPPFGHVAEDELQELASKLGHEAFDGFEGNAQSFRILTHLACRYEDVRGLDLTRATLNAVLKYPWFRDPASGKKRKKFGAYRSEHDDFMWARELGPAADQTSVEAELMDLADDIAYGVHDVEDFYRAGLIPLERLRTSSDEVGDLVKRVAARWEILGKKPKYSEDDLRGALTRILELAPIETRYSGTRQQRASLRTFTSGLIATYVKDVRLKERDGAPESKAVQIDSDLEREITILKELTWQYVILSPSLVAREEGQRRVIKGLFDAYMESASSKQPKLLPAPFQEELSEALGKAPGDEKAMRLRIVIDVITSMNDLQAVRAYHRITGISLGPVLESLPV